MKYRTVVVVMSVFCAAVANQGLAQLIAVAVPVLVLIYPVAIALIALGLLSKLWRHKARVFIPAMSTALVFGLIDGAKAAGLNVPEVFASLPGSEVGLGWLVPVLVVMVVAGVLDRVRAIPAKA